jgi:hypothetical protein
MAATIGSEMIGAPIYGQIRQSESSAPIAGITTTAVVHLAEEQRWLDATSDRSYRNGCCRRILAVRRCRACFLPSTAADTI